MLFCSTMHFASGRVHRKTFQFMAGDRCFFRKFSSNRTSRSHNCVSPVFVTDERHFTLIFQNRTFGGHEMSKLTVSRALKLVNAKKTTLYNAMGSRHGSMHYRRRSRSRGRQHRSLATLLWCAINVLSKRK